MTTLINELESSGKLTQLQDYVRDSAENTKNFHCPVCEKRATVYKRKLHSEMARFLISLYVRDRIYSRYYTMREIFPGSNKAASDGSYLVHWNLVEKADNTNSAGAPAGAYKITFKGKAFVAGQLSVPSHCHMYNNEVVGWSDKHVMIRAALGSKFSYDELLRG